MITIVFLGINKTGKIIYNWLSNQKDVRVLCLLTEKNQLNIIKKLNPDLIISGGFNYIVPNEIINIPPLGVVNMHGSFLPYNKGSNPNIWPILNETPAGVSLHYMTEELDAGPVIDRKNLAIYPDDNAKTLLKRMRGRAVKQFKDNWEDIKNGETNPLEFKPSEGDYHTREQFIQICKLDLEETATYIEVINHLRALTHPPFKNAYFEIDGSKYFIDINIIPANDTGIFPGEYENDVMRKS